MDGTDVDRADVDVDDLLKIILVLARSRGFFWRYSGRYSISRSRSWTLSRC